MDKFSGVSSSSISLVLKLDKENRRLFVLEMVLCYFDSSVE
jgi:hypothetical protein